MNKHEARRAGEERGEGIAQYNELVQALVPGSTEEEVEKAQEDCYEAEDNDRQNSPFEFTAHELRTDASWTAFEEGIVAGINNVIGSQVWPKVVVSEDLTQQLASFLAPPA